MAKSVIQVQELAGSDSGHIRAVPSPCLWTHITIKICVKHRKYTIGHLINSNRGQAKIVKLRKENPTHCRTQVIT